jgi:hypothetical protein
LYLPLAVLQRSPQEDWVAFVEECARPLPVNAALVFRHHYKLTCEEAYLFALARDYFSSIR